MPLDTIAAGQAWTYSHNIGRRATAGMGFNWPVAMAVGKGGVMFVANRTPHISKFTIDQEFIHEFGPTGEFVFLSGIALDKGQNLYTSVVVAEPYHGHRQRRQRAAHMGRGRGRTRSA